MKRGAAVLLLTGLLWTLSASEPILTAQTAERPESETYHWVLPVDQSGVDVATLHPNDCYVVQSAEGVAYFGEPSAGVLELQRRLTASYAHLVETRDEHPECTLASCLQVTAIAAALEREIVAVSDPRWRRQVNHRPSPVDGWLGGAYSDIGSEDRETYRNTAEQHMLFRHQATSRRSNCYEAKVPRTLSVHVRDREGNRTRTGVYRGFLYVEHHHPLIAGQTIVKWNPYAGRSPSGRFVLAWQRPPSL